MDKSYNRILTFLCFLLLVSCYICVLHYTSSTTPVPGPTFVSPATLRKDETRWRTASITPAQAPHIATEQPAFLAIGPQETAREGEQGEVFTDEYFLPIMETFRHPERYEKKVDFRNGSEPTVLVVSSSKLSSVYMQESFYHINHNECPLPCRIIEDPTERDLADALLFFLIDVRSVDEIGEKIPRRDFSQPWIVHATECPATAKRAEELTYKSLNGVFNRTSYFRRDSDVLWTHGFVVSRGDASLLPQSWHQEAPRIFPQSVEKRKMAAAFISNCNDRSGRQNYIEELSKHFPVHVYGKCGSRRCGKSRLVKNRFRVEEDACLRRVAENYLFYLSFENNISEDYVTEKVYNILYYPVVPVVFGGADYTKLLPPNSYVNALHFTPKQLAEHLADLGSDDTKYNEMLRWRKHYVASTVANRRLYCQLCTKLYDPDFYSSNVYENLQDWFVFKSHSNRKYVAGGNVTEFKENITR